MARLCKVSVGGRGQHSAPWAPCNRIDAPVRRGDSGGRGSRVTYSAFAWWDLRRLLFDRGELQSGRGEQISRKLEERIRGLVVSLYGERRRLMIDEVLNEDERLSRRSLFRRLRLEELTAHLNQLTGDLLPPFIALKGL